MPENDRSFLIEQWKTANTFCIAYATKRLTALSVAVTLIAALAALSANLKTLLPAIGAGVVMLTVALVFREVVYCLNQATRVFLAEASRIEKRLGEPGFATNFPAFASRQRVNTGAHAFYIATGALVWMAAIAATCLVAGKCVESNESMVIWIGFGSCALVISVGSMIFYWSRWWSHVDSEVTAGQDGSDDGRSGKCDPSPPTTS